MDLLNNFCSLSRLRCCTAKFTALEFTRLSYDIFTLVGGLHQFATEKWKYWQHLRIVAALLISKQLQLPVLTRPTPCSRIDPVVRLCSYVLRSAAFDICIYKSV